MIFLGATLVSTSGKRERNTLTTSREIPARKHAGKPTICVRKSLNAAIVRCPLTLNFAAYNPPPFCLRCFTNYRLRSLDLTISIVKGVHEGIPSDRALRKLDHPEGGSKLNECATIREWEGETLQYIGSCIQTTRTTNLSKHFEGKPPP